ncbi:hypothetical protein HEB94_009007 [Actinopolymorpha pittospori]|uniref:Calcineurin-like phosphoesterase domain-containing protein n=1 Tax=Actinopolymorpha pittospori TaxID=648752 RepID=A0A927N4W9_9ACTN|nr:hypothetical protein [Actinopolymorpha pittospori]
MTTELPGGCPSVTFVDSQGTRTSNAMIPVSTPQLPLFPTTVCRLPVPVDARQAMIDSGSTQALHVRPAYNVPLPRWGVPTRPRPASIAVIGDTGCETTANAALNQNCLKDWHFHGLSVNAATTSSPDLVVHVGDYVYREEPQLASDKSLGCNVMSERGGWGCLVKDFFEPAEALLAKAPFLFARGNHEACQPPVVGRGVEWWRYLATQIFGNDECFSISSNHPAEAEPVVIDAGTLHFILFDSSAIPDADDFVLNQAVATQYIKWFNQVNALANRHPMQEYFLITHKPLWMVKAASSTAVTWTGPTLAKAVEQTTAKALAPNIRLVLSGHEHLYQMLDFNSTRPPQLTVGSSGTKLETAPDDTKVEGKVVDGEPVTQSISHDIHGYAVLRADPGNPWRLTFHNSAGRAQSPSCTLSTGTTKEFSCP